MPDNLPQWLCAGHLHGVDVQVSMTGGDDGIVDLVIQIPAAANHSAASAALGAVLEVTPRFASSMGPIESWLATWDGGYSTATFGADILRLQSDTTWITLGWMRTAASRSIAPAP